jgi:hypothetical protein
MAMDLASKRGEVVHLPSDSAEQAKLVSEG